MRAKFSLAARAVGAVGLSVGFSGVAFAQGTGPDLTAASSEQVFAVLGAFLVIAVAMESAMATIFHWRIFRLHFAGKGVKTPIMIVVGWLIASQLDLDVFRELVRALGEPNAETGFMSEILTALLLAGGSGGFNAIFQKLGVRSPTLSEPIIRPLPDTAESSPAPNPTPTPTPTPTPNPAPAPAPTDGKKDGGA